MKKNSSKLDELKEIFRMRLVLLCDETQTETGHNPQRLRNTLNGIYGDWFTGINRLILENVNEPMAIEGIDYLINMDNYSLSRFDLTIEAIIVENYDYQLLFDNTVIQACKDKLANLRYTIRR